ncbi:hypothetical protein QBC37DRAFT_68567 [Rhypophila decipiens]|uniref:Uncharacterized protein n=1 Tax=Rhypophila decipiens TaxID=261697 RepID=A0AAN6YIY9_9PEZI|nr:hypothetical protein QBC37DRAFT_68567 [Rhypophila decipiens]
MAGIPKAELKCTLCIKKPNFSDCSHLLTHLGSKGHMASEARVMNNGRQHGPPAPWQQMWKEFHDWKHRWGIDRMLQDRADAKEKKRVAKETHEREEKRTRKEQRAIANPRPQPVPMPAALAAQAAGRNPPRPTMHFHNQLPGRPPVMDNANVQPGPTTPTRVRGPGRLPVWPGVPRTRPADDMDSESSEDELNYKKLKGAKFPGMGMFDSANPEDRKKRNQRKDGSVVEKMKQSSEQVQPTEMVWAQGLGGQAEAKDIYRTPSVNGSEDEDADEINAYLRKEKKKPKGKVAAKAPWRDIPPPQAAPAPIPRRLPQPAQGRAPFPQRPQYGGLRLPERVQPPVHVPQNRYNAPVRQRPEDRHLDCDDDDDVFGPVAGNPQAGNLGGFGQFQVRQQQTRAHPRQALGGLDANAMSFVPTPAVPDNRFFTAAQQNVPNPFGGFPAVHGGTATDSFMTSTGFFPNQGFDFSSFGTQTMTQLAQAQQAPLAEAGQTAMNPMATTQVGQPPVPTHPLYQEGTVYNPATGGLDAAQSEQADEGAGQFDFSFL